MRRFEWAARIGHSAIVLAAIGCLPAGTPGNPEIEAPDLSGLDPVISRQLGGERHRVLARFEEDGLTADEAGESVAGLGTVYHAYGLDRPAADCYRYCIEVSPDNIRCAYLLGRLELDRGNWADAAELLEAVARRDALDVPSAFFAGAARQLGDQNERALAWFLDALERDAGCAAAHYRAAQIEANRQNLSRAVEHYLEALDLQPGATRIHAALAALHRRLGDEEQAKLHVARAGDGVVQLADPVMADIALLSMSVDEMINRGGAAFAQKQYHEARDWFKRASEIQPDNGIVHLNLGSALLFLGQIEDARTEFEIARSLNPSDPKVHFNLGALLAKIGNNQDAIAEYREAIRLDPRYTVAHVNLGNALLRESEFEAAAKHFDTANRIDGSQPDVRSSEAIALSLAGRWDLAVERLQEAFVLFPEDQAVGGGLARLLAACPVEGLRDGQRAIEIAESLIVPSSPLDTVEALAMAYAEVGRFEDAVRVEAKALDAAKRAGRSDLEVKIEENLERYQRGEPCRAPWSNTAF